MENNLYPKTIENLMERIDFIIKNDNNEDRVKNMKNWKIWFSNINYQLAEVLEEKQYLRAFCKEEKYALQIWNIQDSVNSLDSNLVANYHSAYNTSKTLII